MTPQNVSLFIHSFHRFLLSISYVRGTYLIPGNPVVFKTEIMNILRLCLQGGDGGDRLRGDDT